MSNTIEDAMKIHDTEIRPHIRAIEDICAANGMTPCILIRVNPQDCPFAFTVGFTADNLFSDYTADALVRIINDHRIKKEAGQ
jgi:hypothetical protein